MSKNDPKDGSDQRGAEDRPPFGAPQSNPTNIRAGNSFGEKRSLSLSPEQLQELQEKLRPKGDANKDE